MQTTPLDLQADPREVMAALAHAEELRLARLELDRKIIEGLESPLLSEEEMDWDALRKPALEAAAKRGRK